MIQGAAHRVDDLIVLQGNIVLSLGSNHVIPARVTFENGEIGIVFGNYSVPTPIGSIQPELMALNESCAIMSYYGRNNIITAVAGCLTGDEDMNMVWGPIYEYSEDYIFHDIVGLSSNKFIVAHARVPWWYDENVDVYDRQLHPENYPKPTDSTIHYGLGTVYDNLTLSVGEIKQIKKDSFGFMDMARYE